MPEHRLPLGGFNPFGSVRMTAAVVAGGRAVIDDGALHGRSHLEEGIRFVRDRAEVRAGRRVWAVWIALERDPEAGEDAPGGAGGEAGGGAVPMRYAGLQACPMDIDREAGVGFKNLAEHANRLGYAAAGRVDVSGMDPADLEALRHALVEFDPDAWRRAAGPVRAAFPGASGQEAASARKNE